MELYGKCILRYEINQVDARERPLTIGLVFPTLRRSKGVLRLISAPHAPNPYRPEPFG
jgi:hypothetical protein